MHGGSEEGDARESFSSKPFSPSYDQAGEVISVQENEKSGSSATQELAETHQPGCYAVNLAYR